MKQHDRPAFPGYMMEADGTYVTVTKLNPGMSLRDYFAAAALTALITDSCQTIGGGYDAEASAQCYADDAYMIADAMLKAREAKL